MRALFAACVVSAFASIAACSGSSTSNGNTPTDGGGGGGDDGGGGGNDASNDGGVVSRDASMNGDAFNPPMPVVASIGIGPISVAPGEEKTVCIIKRLGNVTDLVATRFSATLAMGSHHLIVYKATETTETLTPFACMPFQGLTQQNSTPILLAGKAQSDYTFPAGVGMPLAANQMLRIEAHYINPSNATIMGTGAMTVEGLAASQAGSYQAADFGFWGTLNISIPPNATVSTPVSFQRGISGTKVFGVSSHQHHLGTEVKVWSSAAAGDTSKVVLDETDWSNPRLNTFSPAIDVASGTGFSYHCSWHNPTASAVTFGESANDEMCFVALYYYPSHGFDRCFDGQCDLPRN